jgi:hypothetical protein
VCLILVVYCSCRHLPRLKTLKLKIEQIIFHPIKTRDVCLLYTRTRVYICKQPYCFVYLFYFLLLITLQHFNLHDSRKIICYIFTFHNNNHSYVNNFLSIFSLSLLSPQYYICYRFNYINVCRISLLLLN